MPEHDAPQDSSPETVVETLQESVSEDVNHSTHSAPQVTEEKTVPYSRFKEVNDQLKKLKDQPKSDSSVDALGFIKLGKKLQDYSDEEIDFATEHAKSKNPDEILKALDNEMVQLAIQGKRAKLEKEKLALRPSGTQPDSDKPRSLAEKLRNASLADQEKILTEAGLYKQNRPRADRVDIGRQR
jgi:hypothetical protein